MPDLEMARLADWSALVKILWFVTVLSLLVERALSLVFEHRVWIALERDFTGAGLKELVAVLLSWSMVRTAGFDAFGLMFARPPSTFGLLLTAGMIAGGSKGMVKLMRDVLGVTKTSAAVPGVRRTRS